MATFRVETVIDPQTGKIYAELYYPDGATTPIATTAPIYGSHAAAEADVLKMLQQTFSP